MLPVTLWELPSNVPKKVYEEYPEYVGSSRKAHKRAPGLPTGARPTPAQVALQSRSVAGTYSTLTSSPGSGSIFVSAALRAGVRAGRARHCRQ